MPSFRELGLSNSLVRAITNLGFEEPTPIQTEAIPALLTGADVLGMAATGTGKTAAFALPLLERYVLNQRPGHPVVLVLTPTRELCLQVSESFHNFGKIAHAVVTPIYGGQEYGRQIKALQRGTHVVVATPGRAIDHIEKGTLKLENIRSLVLDEADEMLDMGFADELETIFDALPNNIQTTLFSATLPQKIARIAEKHLHDPIRIKIAKEKTSEGESPRVPQIAYVVGRNYREAALGRILDLESPELAIIFTRTRMEVDSLTETLRARGYSIEALHGGLDQPTRDRVMKRARAGQVDAIVATDVAARGIDLENLTHVINFGIPASVETYVHRIGRTGRAGRTGTAITILEPREHRQLRTIEKVTHAQVEVRSVPSATDVQAKRLELLRGNLVEVLEAGNLERLHVIVERLSESYDIFDVAAAAIKMVEEMQGGNDDTTEIPAFNPKNKERRRTSKDRSNRRDREAGPQKGMTRLFINIGRNAGIRPNDLVGAIANECGISSRAIGMIDISDRFSLVEVDRRLVNNVLTGMKNTRLKGHPVECRYDRTPQNKDTHRRSDRSDRMTPSRFERFRRESRGQNGRSSRPNKRY